MSLEADASRERPLDSAGDEPTDVAEAALHRCLSCQERSVTERTVCEHPTCGHLDLATAFWGAEGPRCPDCERLETGADLRLVGLLFHCAVCEETFDRPPGRSRR